MSVSPAVRPPPGNPRFPLCDGMRGVAILVVVFAHVSIITGAVRASWGWLPVNAPVADAVFFILSGFLLYRPFASAHAGLRPAPKTLAFARRRLLRIVPTYWVALTLLAVFPGIPGVFSHRWWAYYGFAQVYLKHGYAEGITFAGYICMAVAFYLVLPPLAAVAGAFAARLGDRRWWWAQVGTIGAFGLVGPIATVLLRAHKLPSWAVYSFLPWTDWFAAGMALAVASVAFERRGQTPRVLLAVGRTRIAWPAAAVLFVLAARPFDAYTYALHPGTPQPAGATIVASNLLLGASAVALVLPAMLNAGGGARRVLGWRPLAKLGLISYGIYVWHFPLAAWLAGWHGPPDPIPGTAGGGVHVQRLLGGHATTLVLFAATLAVAVAVASISYRWVELPFLRRKESRPAPRTTAVAAELVSATGASD